MRVHKNKEKIANKKKENYYHPALRMRDEMAVRCDVGVAHSGSRREVVPLLLFYFIFMLFVCYCILFLLFTSIYLFILSTLNHPRVPVCLNQNWLGKILADESFQTGSHIISYESYKYMYICMYIIFIMSRTAVCLVCTGLARFSHEFV